MPGERGKTGANRRPYRQRGPCVSNTDSFIDEVSEEVRRDRLFAVMKRWGWLAALAVILLVGGAAVNEYRKASARAEARATGDAVLAAIRSENAAASVEALNAVPAEGEAAAIVRMIELSPLLETDRPAAVSLLEDLSTSAEASDTVRQLATLKLVAIQGKDMAADARIERLAAISGAGMPFRVLALEQTALVLVEIGQRDKALDILESLVSDQEATAGLRRRASQLIVALGGKIEAG